MKKILLTALLSAGLFSAFAHDNKKVYEQKTYELPVITGENWVNASDDEKRAFLLGFTTLVVLENNLRQGADDGKDSFIPVLSKGLGYYSIDELVDKIDMHYQAEGVDKSRAVVEYIWLGIAAPASKKAPDHK